MPSVSFGRAVYRALPCFDCGFTGPGQVAFIAIAPGDRTRQEGHMLSLHRLAATATAIVATVTFAPAAAQARPDSGQGWAQARSSQDKVSPDMRYSLPQQTTPQVDRVSPDARYGVPDASTPTFVHNNRVGEAPSTGFEWADAAVGGGAALALVLVIAGGAIAVRPRRHAAVR
jgi:hypothetical protein